MSLTSFFTIVCFFEIDVLVCILFPVQFSKIMCTSAVLIYITKYFPSCKPLFLKNLKKVLDVFAFLLYNSFCQETLGYRQIGKAQDSDSCI